MVSPSSAKNRVGPRLASRQQPTRDVLRFVKVMVDDPRAISLERAPRQWLCARARVVLAKTKRARGVPAQPGTHSQKTTVSAM
jgi:hypothetical protein